jgi:hypothetical protein
MANEGRMMWALAWLAVAATVACGGTSSSIAVLSDVQYTASGFHRGNVPYDLLFKNEKTLEIIDRDWIISNWAAGEGDAAPERRDGPSFLGYTLTDYDGDGSAERLYGYYSDVEFRNRKNDGAIWISVEGMSPRNRDKDLSVFVESYVDGLSGEDFGLRRTRWGWVKSDAKIFAAALVGSKRMQLAGMDAVVATISVANVERLALDSSHRYGFIRLVFIRVPGKFVQYFEGVGKTIDERGLMMIGYFNSPEFFETDLGALDAILGQLRIAGRPISTDELHDAIVESLGGAPSAE